MVDDRDLGRGAVPESSRRGLMIMMLMMLVRFSFPVVLHQQTAHAQTVRRGLLMRRLLGRRRVHAAGATAVPLVPVQHDRYPALVVHYFPRRRLVLQLQRVDCLANDFRYCRDRCNTRHTHTVIGP